MSTTCATNVFVAATPISIPARVNSTASASRVAWLPAALVTATTAAPLARASRIAARVSAVSPDCVIASTSVPGAMIGSR